VPAPAPFVVAPSEYNWGNDAARFGDPEPMTRHEFGQSMYDFVPARSGTVSVWLIALAPIVSILSSALILAVVVFTQSPFLAVLAALAWPLANLAWAVRDRQVLSRFGYLEPAHWGWIFLGPLAYLIARTVRTRREAKKGAAPLITYGAINVGFVILSIVLTVLAPTIAGPFVATIAEETIVQNEIARTGTAYTVSCPADGDYFDKTTPVSCEVVDMVTGATGTVIVTYIGSGGQPYAYSEPVLD
jgi:hypothetical protein